ncbi:SMP-30/gluconolactonase/LRE family protein [Brevibacterium sp. 5221]|uniref:SMP-30/gluconolactonase/LRE family protein n=1 Tax=Brevibacterium rongguiense TaxID=2695267 RepID=A0A6N9H7B3_9MICO|nr:MULTISPECIES: SMP-30/gluconolactonase/LRE family protein [Brevibacterium]MYM19849.1 SMP-30/gluconolactonase/LRE family protein [Brevibacterium rongguiense]WAL39246.1 SMP-30/gluconolactonase/LRE family protein [Brevibacterium sp. BRM-1]
MKAEQITDPIAYHGEGPVWCETWSDPARAAGAGTPAPTWAGLRWVDMLAGDVLSLRESGVSRTHVGEVAAAVRPRTAGGAVIGVERGFALEAPDGEVTALPPLWASPEVRMNEGGCAPDGTFWCGSMAYDQAPGAARLYRLDPDGGVALVLDAVTVSNGLEWSPDGSLLYYNDTATGQIAVFDYEPPRRLGPRRVLADVPGSPDGMAVDAEGAVWTALADRGEIRRYLPDGTLDGIVEVPAQKTTACAFGGEGLRTLFITTSQEDIDTEADPLAGALFAAEVGVAGRPVRSFAG